MKFREKNEFKNMNKGVKCCWTNLSGLTYVLNLKREKENRKNIRRNNGQSFSKYDENFKAQ